MKKIGFIDYYLDEFHANKYPEWIAQASNGTMKVEYAYGQVDSRTGMTNQEWSETHGIQLLPSIEEVVRLSDCLVVLSPDNPEFHEELSQLPLKSGKPTYIDKTFAPDRSTAIRLFELAKQHGTPVYSTSALRYACEFAAMDLNDIKAISSWGPGQFANYSIHQIEPIVQLIGSEPKRVKYVGNDVSPALLIDFGEGKQAEIRHFGGDVPFMMALTNAHEQSRIVKVKSNFFGLFIEKLVAFFETGEPAVAEEETVAVITIVEYGHQAMRTAYEWIDLP